jgi:hypothetical protein
LIRSYQQRVALLVRPRAGQAEATAEASSQQLAAAAAKKCFFCPLGGTTLGKLLFALYISTNKVA